MSILTVLNRRVLAFKIFEIKDVAIVAKNICTFFFKTINRPILKELNRKNFFV